MDLQGLWWLSIGTECAALTALFVRHIAASYRWFALYLAFGVARGVALHLIAGRLEQNRYAIAWMTTEPILLALLLMTTIEIVGKVPDHYRGFGNFGRQKLRRLLDVAMVVALLSSIFEAAGPQWKWTIWTFLPFTIALHRITTSFLALYLLLVAWFVSRVPVPFRRNMVIHSRLLASYLALQTAVMLYLAAVGHGTQSANDLLTGGTGLLFLLWTALLTSEGEALPARKVLTPGEIEANEERERALQEAARRYSDRPLG